MPINDKIVLYVPKNPKESPLASRAVFANNFTRVRSLLRRSFVFKSARIYIIGGNTNIIADPKKAPDSEPTLPISSDIYSTVLV